MAVSGGLVAPLYGLLLPVGLTALSAGAALPFVFVALVVLSPVLLIAGAVAGTAVGAGLALALYLALSTRRGRHHLQRTPVALPAVGALLAVAAVSAALASGNTTTLLLLIWSGPVDLLVQATLVGWWTGSGLQAWLARHPNFAAAEARPPAPPVPAEPPTAVVLVRHTVLAAVRAGLVLAAIGLVLLGLEALLVAVGFLPASTRSNTRPAVLPPFGLVGVTALVSAALGLTLGVLLGLVNAAWVRVAPQRPRGGLPRPARALGVVLALVLAWSTLATGAWWTLSSVTFYWHPAAVLMQAMLIAVGANRWLDAWLVGAAVARD